MAKTRAQIPMTAFDVFNDTGDGESRDSTPIGGTTMNRSKRPTKPAQAAAMASVASAAPSDATGQAELYKIEMGGAGRSDHYAASSTKPGEASPKKVSWNLPEPKEWVVIGFNINVAGGN